MGNSIKNGATNLTTGLGAANAHTEEVNIKKGDYKFKLSGTFDATFLLLRKPTMINRRQVNELVQDGGDNQAVLTDASVLSIIADELIGMYCRNSVAAKDELALITDNTATVVTCALPTADFDNGDTADLWEVVGTYTTEQDLVGTNGDEEADYMVLCSAYTSGVGRAIISQ